MSELIFQDITNVIVPILMSILQSCEASNWKWQHDWLQQVAVYRYYPTYNMLILKLKECKSADFYKSYIGQRRLLHINEALKQMWGETGPLEKLKIEIFGRHESAEAWMKENVTVTA